MTKQDVIKNAYGDHWDLLTDFQKQYAIKNNGFIVSVTTDVFIELRNSKLYDLQPIRPKSLQGIEDNNGWIKIESENDLPKEVMFIECMSKHFGSLESKAHFLHHFRLTDKDYVIERASHWKKIEFKPPIY